MHRITIFVLVSCVAFQRLAGAVRNGEPPSGRRNLYFDSYDHPSLEEFGESEDGLRDAVLLNPDQILDVPPIPVERSYEMADLDTEAQDRPYGSVWSSQTTRGFFQDLLEEIQNAFSNWPPVLPDEPLPAVEYRYQFDSSLLDTQKAELKLLLAIAEEKTCLTIVENEESPQIIFMGIHGCSVESVENKIVIGYDCFEPTMILKLIFNLFSFCESKTEEPTFKANGRPVYLDNYRSTMQREAEQDSNCEDIFGFCPVLAKGNSSFPCTYCSYSEKVMCSRTCRICGDSCVDYDTDCNSHDILKDCLSNWDQKKVGCANTCGLCKKRKEFGVCADFYPCCQYYAKRGYCQKLPEVMKKYCAPSCGYCKPKSCVDLRTDCSYLKNLGGCEKMSDLMEKNCRRTCNFCRNGLEYRDNDEKSPSNNCNPDYNFIKKYCTWYPFIVE